MPQAAALGDEFAQGTNRIAAIAMNWCRVRNV